MNNTNSYHMVLEIGPLVSTCNPKYLNDKFFSIKANLYNHHTQQIILKYFILHSKEGEKTAN